MITQNMAALGAHPAVVQAATKLGTTNLKTWISNNVISLVILVLGVVILFAAKNGNLSKGVTIMGGALIGICFLGLASGTNATDLGTWALGMIGLGNGPAK